MQMTFFWVSVAIGLALATMIGWRQLDRIADRAEQARLRAFQPSAPPRFSSDMVADLPDPARRFFLFSIADGTPLNRVVELEMAGKFSLGTKEAPNYMAMTAQQVLAAPEGFIWSMSAKSAVMRVSGSDSAKWTRFWVGGVVPVARLGGDADHKRSAFGRYAAEALFWSPATFLPGPGVTWEAVSKDTARATLRHGSLAQTVEIVVADDGQPLHVSFARWSNANPDKVFRLQPFGGYLSSFKDVAGFRLPTHVEAGNHFGTDDYFPFFVVDVTQIRFPSPQR